MTIDPKAAELAKALADAVAAQESDGYKAKRAEVERLESEAEVIEGELIEIDQRVREAEFALREHYAPKVGQGSGSYLGSPRPVPEPGFCTPGIDASIFDPPSNDPAHYELPEDDETMTARPNGGLVD